jgi:Uma2 family endonuclease
MTAILAPQLPGPIVYPDSDGEPMSDNTEQGRWIFVFHGNLSVLMDGKAFVAMNLLWYAREGFLEERAAPDVFVAFGRPKGKRGSYKQWEEDDVVPQVVFEIRSPGNSDEEMAKKYLFYEEHGVQEYYIYDPDTNELKVYLRRGSVFIRQNFTDEYISPLLGIRFDLTGEEMVVYYPDGRRFLTFEELDAERRKEAELRTTAEKRATAAEQRLQSTQAELQTAKERATTAEQKLQSTEEAFLTAKAQAARVAELSRKVLLQQATPEEILELQKLLQPPA